jgi:hypothetical protein
LNALESKGAINFPRLIDCNTNPKFYGSGEMSKFKIDARIAKD